MLALVVIQGVTALVGIRVVVSLSLELNDELVQSLNVRLKLATLSHEHLAIVAALAS